MSITAPLTEEERGQSTLAFLLFLLGGFVLYIIGLPLFPSCVLFIGFIAGIVIGGVLAKAERSFANWLIIGALCFIIGGVMTIALVHWDANVGQWIITWGWTLAASYLYGIKATRAP